MKTPDRVSRLVSRFVLCVLCVSVAIPSVLAQSCAMCYKTAAQSGPSAIRALAHGIFALLIPTLTFFVGIIVFAVRRARSSE